MRATRSCPGPCAARGQVVVFDATDNVFDRTLWKADQRIVTDPKGHDAPPPALAIRLGRGGRGGLPIDDADRTEQEGPPVGPSLDDDTACVGRDARRADDVPERDTFLVDVLGADESKSCASSTDSIAALTLAAVPAPGGLPDSFSPTIRVPAMAAKSAAFRVDRL